MFKEVAANEKDNWRTVSNLFTQLGNLHEVTHLVSLFSSIRLPAEMKIIVG